MPSDFAFVKTNDSHYCAIPLSDGQCYEMFRNFCCQISLGCHRYETISSCECRTGIMCQSWSLAAGDTISLFRHGSRLWRSSHARLALRSNGQNLKIEPGTASLAHSLHTNCKIEPGLHFPQPTLKLIACQSRRRAFAKALSLSILPNCTQMRPKAWNHDLVVAGERCQREKFGAGRKGCCGCRIPPACAHCNIYSIKRATTSAEFVAFRSLQMHGFWFRAKLEGVSACCPRGREMRRRRRRIRKELKLVALVLEKRDEERDNWTAGLK